MLYALLDTSVLRRIGGENALNESVRACMDAFLRAGVKTVQLRAKSECPRRVLELALVMREETASFGHHAGAWSDVELILNDRPDLALLAAFDGCHIGQDDLSVAGARKILPRPHIVGISTHNQQQLEAADATGADYIAIGPIFGTQSKQDPDPVVGLAELTRLRKLTRKRVVAIGGITRDNARSVLDAGADEVAIIGDLYSGAEASTIARAVERNSADILAAIR